MFRFKYLILFMLLMLLPTNLPAQSSGGDRLYNEAVALMEKGNRSSLNKAIATFKKAKLSYVSSEGKGKCDAMISECQRRLKNDKSDPKKAGTSAKRNEARTKFDAAVSFKQQGDFQNATKYFKEAKELFQPTDAEEIAKCEEEILICEHPLQFATPSVSIACQGGDQSVQVKSLLKEDWTIGEINSNWIKASKTAEGISVVLLENETSDTRECTISLQLGSYSAELNVRQYGQLSYKIDGEDDSVFYLFFKNKDNSKLLVSCIKVPENAEWKIVPESTSEWIFTDPNPRSFGVTVTKHSGKEPRKGKIAVAYTLDGCENITYIPVFQGLRLPKKGWGSAKEFFSEK